MASMTIGERGLLWQVGVPLPVERGDYYGKYDHMASRSTTTSKEGREQPGVLRGQGRQRRRERHLNIKCYNTIYYNIIKYEIIVITVARNKLTVIKYRYIVIVYDQSNNCNT